MQIVNSQLSVDGRTVIHTQRTHDGKTVKTAQSNRGGAYVIRFSVQKGCTQACLHCDSGLVPLERQLTDMEMVRQCMNVVGTLPWKTGVITSLGLETLGEGEPCTNFKNCMAAILEMDCMQWSVPIRFLISTTGVRPDLILKLAKYRLNSEIDLQIWLHGGDDETRKLIVPRTGPVAKIVEAAKEYQARSGRRVIFNYVIRDGVNDSKEQAHAVVKLLGPDSFVRFNRHNVIPGLPFRPSPIAAVNAFRDILRQGGVEHEDFETEGADVGAACGMISSKQ
ncbi:MAG: radical SAM protein [bacterium]|nr:radical SAM protein [bacterium]